MRCHKDFVEVENDDRSCLVPHDDDSAEVERVGRGTGLEARRTAGGTEYETLWGCCGKTTEGNGDQGPPDGFCYEGRHTVSRLFSHILKGLDIVHDPDRCQARAFPCRLYRSG